ncbi:hypothetical protein [Paenibacillus eucommiae]|uniref:Membrane protein involved in colicin uptake n=1 Tax=Paenibacillus eucommiae TaxID=1355755 RepID=A0ABS4J1I6_9BACL|nr:hypothetical protein [Paenibacillus eucommiae]MBP1993687.1 membrane protein involved in colicin uptake [Paenibacillus eucommiae]
MKNIVKVADLSQLCAAAFPALASVRKFPPIKKKTLLAVRLNLGFVQFVRL